MPVKLHIKRAILNQQSQLKGFTHLFDKLSGLNSFGESGKKHSYFQLSLLPPDLRKPIKRLSSAAQVPPLLLWTFYSHIVNFCFSKSFFLNYFAEPREKGLRGGRTDFILKNSGIGLGRVGDFFAVMCQGLQTSLDKLRSVKDLAGKNILDLLKHPTILFCNGKSGEASLANIAANGQGGWIRVLEPDQDGRALQDARGTYGPLLSMNDKIVSGGNGVSRGTKTRGEMNNNSASVLIGGNAPDWLNMTVKSGAAKGIQGRVNTAFVSAEGMGEGAFQFFPCEAFYKMLVWRLQVISTIFRVGSGDESACKMDFVLTESQLLTDYKARVAEASSVICGDDIDDEESMDMQSDELDGLAKIDIKPPSDAALVIENSGEAIMEVFKRKQESFFSAQGMQIQEIGARAVSNMKLSIMTIQQMRVVLKNRKATRQQYEHQLYQKFGPQVGPVQINGDAVKEATPLAEYCLTCTVSCNLCLPVFCGAARLGNCATTDSLELRILKKLKAKTSPYAFSRTRNELKTCPVFNSEHFTKIMTNLVELKIVKKVPFGRRGFRLSLSCRKDIPQEGLQHLARYSLMSYV